MRLTAAKLRADLRHVPVGYANGKRLDPQASQDCPSRFARNSDRAGTRNQLIPGTR